MPNVFYRVLNKDDDDDDGGGGGSALARSRIPPATQASVFHTLTSGKFRIKGGQFRIFLTFKPSF